MQRKKRVGQRLKWILGSLLVLYLAGMGLITSFQEKLIFLPTPLENDFDYQFETPFQELFIDAKDGAKLNALHFKAQNPKGIILYFHGNAGNLERWGEIAELFPKSGWDVLIMDYRTYGKSTGELNETALYEDAQLLYNEAKSRFSEKQILVYGRSLGCVFATKVAAQNNPQQLVLETPFYNLYDVAKRRFPILPLKSLLRYQFPNNENIKKVECPVTIFHGTKDEVVDYDSGKQLFQEISHDHKSLITIYGGGHNNLIEFDTYRKEISEVLASENTGREVPIPTGTNN